MQVCRDTEEDRACLGEKTNSKHDVIFRTIRHGRHVISQMGIYIHKKTLKYL